MRCHNTKPHCSSGWQLPCAAVHFNLTMIPSEQCNSCKNPDCQWHCTSIHVLCIIAHSGDTAFLFLTLQKQQIAVFIRTMSPTAVFATLLLRILPQSHSFCSNHHMQTCQTTTYSQRHPWEDKYTMHKTLKCFKRQMKNYFSIRFHISRQLYFTCIPCLRSKKGREIYGEFQRKEIKYNQLHTWPYQLESWSQLQLRVPVWATLIHLCPNNSTLDVKHFLPWNHNADNNQVLPCYK